MLCTPQGGCTGLCFPVRRPTPLKRVGTCVHPGTGVRAPWLGGYHLWLSGCFVTSCDGLGLVFSPGSLRAIPLGHSRRVECKGFVFSARVSTSQRKREGRRLVCWQSVKSAPVLPLVFATMTLISSSAIVRWSAQDHHCVRQFRGTTLAMAPRRQCGIS